MGEVVTVINKIVDALITDIQTATTLGLGAAPTVREWDEHPAIPAERGELPLAYVIPIVEGKDKIDMTMGGPNTFHTFPITFVAYYKGTTDSRTQVITDLRTTRNYAYSFIEYYRTKGNFIDRGQITSAELEAGYWEGGGNIIHFWIVKLNIKTSV